LWLPHHFLRRGIRTLNRNEAEAFLKKPGAKFHTYRVNGHTEVGIETRAARGASASSITRYLQGDGRFHIAAPTRAAKGRLAKFLRGRFVGLGRSVVDSIVAPTSAGFSGQAKLVFSGRGAGAACISFDGKTVPSSLQKAKGQFKVLGGTGAAKRLHAAGKFRTVIRFPHKQGAEAAFEANPTLGSKRPMPRYCGRLPPVNGGGGKKVTASFKGFAVSTGAPSASRSLTIDGGSISPCPGGGDLWGVVKYQGPKAARFATETGLKGAAGEKHSYRVKSGRNALRLLDLRAGRAARAS
jgi:hypothetical protein